MLRISIVILASQTHHLQKQNNLLAELLFTPVIPFSVKPPGHHISTCSHHLLTPFT